MSEPFYFTWGQQKDAPQLPVKSAHGVSITLENGAAVLDLSSTSFQAAFGYSNAPILAALQQQLTSLPLASPKAVFHLKRQVTERLLRYMQLPQGKIFYTVSGAESVENALKMARQVSGKKYILARQRSYHGATLGALSVTGDWRHDGHLHLGEYTLRIPEPHDDPDLQKTRALIMQEPYRNSCAAFCLETVPGMNGVYEAPSSWWKGIQDLAREFGILLIIDEVTCGFGRTGQPFGFHKYSVTPDFVCVAKIISGGYIPFGALWTSEKVAKFYDTTVLSCGLTSYAHPLGLAALNAVLDQLEDPSFQQHLKELQQDLSNYLEELRHHPSVQAVRQVGLLAAVEMKEAVSWQKFLKHGVFVTIGKNTAVIAPPFVMTRAELQEAMGIFASCL